MDFFINLLIKIELKKQMDYQQKHFSDFFIKVRKLFYLIAVQLHPLQNYLYFLLKNHYFFHLILYYFVITQLMTSTVFIMKINLQIACICAGLEKTIMVNEISTFVIILFLSINSTTNYLSNWISNVLEKNLTTMIINFLFLNLKYPFLRFLF